MKSLIATLSLGLISMSAAANPFCEGLDAPPALMGDKPATSLCSFFAAPAVLVVNTASQCGFTPQFSELQELHSRYKDQGLTILGFPTDNFGGQEFDSPDKTAKVCYRNYGVEFPMFRKVDAIGPEAYGLFQRLSRAAGEPRWNFHKYLIVGESVTAYKSSVSPLSQDLIKPIEQALRSDDSAARTP